ncbi:MAG: sigma-70 family RNA polymerase sigma factor [Terracidiphilus sp.]
MARPSSMSATELIYACAESSDDAAWQEFVARFRRPICLSIIRTACHWGAIPQQVVDDLAQDTYLKLCADRCRLLRAFASERPEAIEGYIRTIAVNVTHDHFKSLHSQKRGSGMVVQLVEDIDNKSADGDFGAQDTMEREILLKEIGDCLKACSEGPDQERDCLIFWLYYRQGLSAKAIAALPTVGLTAKGVESVIFRLTRLVRERVVQLRDQSQTSLDRREKGFRAAESF